MNTERDFETTTAAWLNAGSDATPPHVIDAVLLAARSTPQERDYRISWRTSPTKRLAYAVAAVAAVAVAVTALSALGPRFGIGPGPTPHEGQSVDLGIFAPVAGSIVYYGDSGLFAIDPSAPSPAPEPVGFGLEGTAGVTEPLGWSSDGTRLLITRGSSLEAQLFILHADGSETQVTERPMAIRGATISPDGSRVVFAGGTDTPEGECCARWALYAVDAAGGSAEMLREARNGFVEDPTFSPDGTRIAYADGAGDHSHSVWLMDADGSGAHQIVSNEVTSAAGHVYGLAWSPDGDRIALGIEGSTYTFATDGSGFTRVITTGDRPYWSPDGTQIAYTVSCAEDFDGCTIAIANADGSNVLTLGYGASGPWHPGTREAVVHTPSIPPETEPVPSVDLGIFEPVAGWIVYGDQSGIWAVEQTAPAATRVQLSSEAGTPLGWSRDGTRLLIARGGPGDEQLFVLHADGSETQVTDRPMPWSGGSSSLHSSIGDATFSADGSRVVVAAESADGEWAVYSIDADGGPATVLTSQIHPWPAALTFSPDGTRIAYVLWGHGDAEHPVWVMNADGTDAHEIVANDIVMGGGHIRDRDGALAWSPDGSRIALGLGEAIYTFATDGSDFTRVMIGQSPVWSPDGSQLVSRSSATWHPGTPADGAGG